MALAACSPSLAPPPGAWLALPAPPVELINPVVVGFRDGGALVLAGQSAVPRTATGVHGVPLPTVEEFAGGTWSLRAPEPEALYDSGIVILPNQDVLVVGGVDSQDRTVQKVFLYDPTADRWTRMPDLPAARAGLFAVVLKDGTVLVGGGASGWPNDFPPPSGLSSAWIFDPATAAWRSISSMHTGRLFASATLLPDGTVLIAGGDDRGSPLASAEVFDPTTSSWTVVASMPQARGQQLATLMGGNVVVMGGSAFNTFGGGFVANPSLDAEIFDVRSRSWSLGSPPGFNLNVPAFAAVAPVAAQRILVLAPAPQVALAYDVGADYWSSVTPAPHWEAGPTLTPMANGKVLFLTEKSAWLFDPNGNARSSDTGLGTETVVLAVIAGVLLLLIGLQRVFRGWRPVPG
ncbi:MAG TPA: kelch repeat-containing protein [Candidatus Limnocylindrales bacterium]|nr:kelch repeat-containing protein [Candidatus Limnocylindrales bacterium]